MSVSAEQRTGVTETLDTPERIFSAHLWRRWRCPECHDPNLRLSGNGRALTCRQCAAVYPMSNGKPVLLRRDNEVFPLSEYARATVPRRPAMQWSRVLPSASVNLVSHRSLQQFAADLSSGGSAVVLVVGGGNQRRWLDRQFAKFTSVRLVYSDVSAAALVDCYCDAHELPFQDGSFDGVITTAVLEHVLYPERVAAEIHRVLRADGLLYSELPFMQQVHEGAYDFTRYTLSGHRRLFNRFAVIDCGMVAGPATALLWALEHFAAAFFTARVTRQVAKAAVRLGFFWIKYLDYVLRRNVCALDGASCTFLLARRQEAAVSDRDIIRGYRGATGHKGPGSP